MNKLLVALLITLQLPSIHSEEKTVTFESINQAFGIELFSDDSLWDDSDEDVAGRLGWPLEGKTTDLSSYRVYSKGDYQVLNTPTYTAALYCKGSLPDRISMMFSNKGDYPDFSHGAAPDKKQIKAFEDVLEAEEEKLEATLTSLLGEPVRGKMGKGKQIREKLQRWDWNEHAILLSVQDGEYVSLRITKPEFADNKGIIDSLADKQLKELLKQRVIRRDNGDVIISEIPMTNQGPKGYCVPATWERYLRFLGIPADMYVLARAGSSGYGGGTYLGPIAEAVDDIARDFGRKLDDADADLDPHRLAKYIDAGLPLMWAVYAESPLYMQSINQRTKQRSKVTDWDQWKEDLKDKRDAVRKMEGLRQGGHVCMIIGYNETTNEIATSDSWGKHFVERWMTVEEAEAMSQGKMQLIKW